MLDSTLRIVLVGGREFTRHILHDLVNSSYTVSGVVTPSAKNRSNRVGYVSMSEVCSTEDITHIKTDNINDNESKKEIQELEPDVILCCGWTQIISETVLDIPKKGFFGVHASSLPKDRGGAPVNWQLIKGRDEIGVSLFEFVPEVDHGDILKQTAVQIEDRDNIATVYDKVTVTTFDLLREGLSELDGNETDLTSQSFANATYNPKRKPKDGLIDWTRSPTFQWNWIRAQTDPYPGAFTFYEGEKVIIWDATVRDYQTSSGEPGKILSVENGEGVLVQTGDGTILIERIEFENSPSMWADTATTQYNLSEGAVLGHPDHFPDWLYTGLRDVDGGFQYETNSVCGDSARFHAVCCSHASPQPIRIEATLNGQIVSDEEIVVEGWDVMPIEVQPTSGSNTLRVKFESKDREMVDIRRVKIYAE